MLQRKDTFSSMKFCAHIFAFVPSIYLHSDYWAHDERSNCRVKTEKRKWDEMQRIRNESQEMYQNSRSEMPVSVWVRFFVCLYAVASLFYSPATFNRTNCSQLTLNSKCLYSLATNRCGFMQYTTVIVNHRRDVSYVRICKYIASPYLFNIIFKETH